MQSAVLLATVGLLLAAPCQSAPGQGAAATRAGKGDAALRGAWWLSSASQAAADPWWVSYLPAADAFMARWGSQLATMEARVNASANTSDADPLWREAAELIAKAALDTQPGRNFTKLCQQGMQAEYAAAACAEGAFGSTLVNGTPADAYFCGSNASGINWTRSWWANYTPPVQQACSAAPGSAYDEAGLCGRWTTRQLVLGTFRSIPLWRADPVTMNVPSLRCLMGLGNCDIYYCQNCPGRCGPA